MDLLQKLQDSAFAYWLSQGAYPVIITLHSIGMALLVGLLTVICLRILGVVPGLPIHSLRRYMKFVWLGFGINAASGTLLFAISPIKFLHNGLFIFKLCFIVSGLTTGGAVNAKLLADSDDYSLIDTEPTPTLKAVAALSILCWLCAIVAGRLLAYSTFSDIGIGGVH